MRLGGNTLTAESPNTYSGATVLMGGALTLDDNATLSNTSSLTLNYATLNINNEADLFIGNNNRVNDAAPITINGSTILFNGLANANSFERLGALTTASGANTITAGAFAVGTYGNADLSFASISHSPDATVNFTSSSGTLGLGGTNPRILFTDPSGLAYSTGTGVIGAWAIANSDTFAGYNPSLGVGAVGTSGYQGYAGGYMSGGTVTTVNNVAIFLRRHAQWLRIWQRD